jgi:hypothetical protein
VTGSKGAYLGVEFEPPVRSKHQDGRRAERVFRGEEDAKVVEPSLELCADGTTDCTVPFLGLIRWRIEERTRITYKYVVLKINR